jgi:hypothetical protein
MRKYAKVYVIYIRKQKIQKDSNRNATLSPEVYVLCASMQQEWGGGKRLAALISSETLPLEHKKNPKKTGGSIAQEQKKTRGAISNGSNNARSFF